MIIGDGPHLSLVHSCSFKGLLFLFICLIVSVQFYTEASLLLSFAVISFVNFKHFFLCVIFFLSPKLSMAKTIYNFFPTKLLTFNLNFCFVS